MGRGGREAVCGEATTVDLQRTLERFRAVAWQSAAHVMGEEIGAAIGRVDEIRAQVEAGEVAFDEVGRS